jgi:hypothetical protein
MKPTRAQFQKDAELMINVDAPKTKRLSILARKPVSKARGRADLQIVNHNDGANSRVAECEKERVLALGRIRRAIHENEPRLFQTRENVGVFFEVERFDKTQPVPATGERDHERLVARSFRDKLAR